MTHFGISIDQTTNDLFFSTDGNLAMVSGAEAVGQHARQRLKTFENEWFLDSSAGVPWLSELLGKGFDPALAEAVVKAELLDTDGVTGISSFSVGYNRTKRELIIRDIQVETVYEQEASL